MSLPSTETIINENTPVTLEDCIEETKNEWETRTPETPHSSLRPIEIQFNNPTIINENTPVTLEDNIDEISNDWETWTPVALRTTPHPNLRPSKKQYNNNPQATSLLETTTSIPKASSHTIQNTASKPTIIPRKRFKQATLAATTNKNFSDLALKKMKLVILQLENAKHLHESQIKQESELFELKKELLLTKIELKKKKLQQL